MNNNQTIDLSISDTTLPDIINSFDRIAIELLSSFHLAVNSNLYAITEIEFYYFKEKIHEDHTAHEHEIDTGKWRFHSQGLDISLGYDGESYDGGILLRGIGLGDRYINGPRRVAAELLNAFGFVMEHTVSFGLRRREDTLSDEVYKTKRHGLTENSKSAFLESKYRYYLNVEKWDVFTCLCQRQKGAYVMLIKMSSSKYITYIVLNLTYLFINFF